MTLVSTRSKMKKRVTLDSERKEKQQKFTFQSIPKSLRTNSSQQKLTFQSHHNKSSHSNAFQQCSHPYVLQKFTFQLITTEVHIPTHHNKSSHSNVLQKFTFQCITKVHIPTQHIKI
jgi:hypothetical protein